MPGIKHLKEVHDKKGDDFLGKILNEYVIINENINGSFFGVKKSEDDSFKFFKKSGQITYVDQMLMKFYNKAIEYFNNIPKDKINRIPNNLYFGFQYITNRDSSNSKYDKKPKNDLVLSYIHKLDEEGKPIETLQSKEELERWAYFLEVEAPPIIFEGRLDDDQKTSILEFIHTPFEELVTRFKTTSFTKFIISVLNPEIKSSFLMNGLKDGIGEIIFRFYEMSEESKSSVFLAKLVDPIFQEKNKVIVKPENKSNDYIWLIVIDLMNYIETQSESKLRDCCKSSEDYDERFICMINHIFKGFIEEYSFKYEGLRLDVPDYLKRPEFDIEHEFIGDPEVENIIKNNETYTEVYRILANFFRRVRKKSSSNFFSPELLTNLNIQIKKLKRIVTGDKLYEALFPTFSEYVNQSPETMFLGEESNSKKDNKVNVLIGRFQPFHNGYIKSIDKLYEKNGLKTILICQYKKNSSNPFSESTVRVLLEKVQQEFSDMIEDIKLVDSISIQNIMSEIVPDYSPILWASNKDRINDYALQFEYIKKKNNLFRIDDDFKLIKLDSSLNSSEILDIIDKEQYSEFKKLVPKSIYSEFF
jgi:hypothetical protein